MKREKPKPIAVKLRELLKVVEDAKASTPNRLKVIYRNTIFRVKELNEIDSSYEMELNTLIKDSVEVMDEKGTKASFDLFSEKLNDLVDDIIDKTPELTSELVAGSAK